MKINKHCNEANFFISERLLNNTSVEGVKLFRLDFDKNNYHVSLFEESNIKLPDQISRSVIKRQAEFFAGRYTANRILSTFGHANFDINIGDQRNPIWPTEIVASISHTDRTAICAGGLKSNIKSIGIDLENWIPSQTISEIKDLTMHGREEELAKNCEELEFEEAFTLIFSAKESLYKAIYPQVGKFFDFSAAEVIRISSNEQSFTICILVDLSNEFTKGMRFDGYFKQDNNTIFTMVVDPLKHSFTLA